MRIPYASGSPPSPDGREEWLLDDAIDDTFPASDPVSHNQPGSILNTRYAARERRARAPRSGDRTFWWLATGAVLAALVLVLRRRRSRDELR
jgi:hypothetical protein